MINTCKRCKEYQIDKEIIHRNGKSFAICGHCKYPNPFISLPLFIISGASGVGKTTTMRLLKQEISNMVFLDGDIMTKAHFSCPKENENIFRIFKNIHQNGLPVVLSTCLFPQHFENSLEKRYFSKIHFLALYCSERDLLKRLSKRPKWRHKISSPFVETNRWVKSQLKHNTQMTFFNTSEKSPVEIKDEIKQYLTSVDWTQGLDEVNVCQMSTL